jgi:hypothetical protein
MATSRSCGFIAFFADMIAVVVKESRFWSGHCVCHKPSVRFSAIHGSTRLCSSCDHDKAVTAEIWRSNRRRTLRCHGLLTMFRKYWTTVLQYRSQGYDLQDTAQLCVSDVTRPVPLRCVPENSSEEAVRGTGTTYSLSASSVTFCR